MIATDTLTANDSIRSVFTSGLTGAGQTVTTLGSGEIEAAATIPDTTSFTGNAFFNSNYLTQDSIQIMYSGAPYSKSNFSYTLVGAYRVATLITDLRYASLPSSEQTVFSTTAGTMGVSVSFLYSATEVKTTSISSISIP
jgi:hypothetical protein